MMTATMIYEQVGRGNKWECCQLWGILLPQCLLTSGTNHDGRWISSHIFFNAVNHGMADADSVQPDPHHTIDCLYLSRALSSRKSSSASVEKIGIDESTDARGMQIRVGVSHSLSIII